MPDDFVPVFFVELWRAMPAGFLRSLVFNGRRQPAAFSPAFIFSLKLHSHGGERVGYERNFRQKKFAESPLLFCRRFAGEQCLLEFLKGLKPQHCLLAGRGVLRVFEARKVLLQVITFLKRGSRSKCAYFARLAVIEIEFQALNFAGAGVTPRRTIE